MMTELPPYSGEAAVCPKCLCDDVSVEYHPAGTALATPTGVVVFRFGAPEWILRRCVVCRYCWAELTMTGGS